MQTSIQEIGFLSETTGSCWRYKKKNDWLSCHLNKHSEWQGKEWSKHRTKTDRVGSHSKWITTQKISYLEAYVDSWKEKPWMDICKQEKDDF